jgi:hypothetical protein
MQLTLTRTTRTDISTIGELFIDDRFFCYALEDFDRGLTSDMPLIVIKEKKVYGKTAIPTGKYEVIMSYSEKFKRYLPLLLNVPCYDGIRMHNGNYATDTDGCLIVGTATGKDAVWNSRQALNMLLAKLTAVEKKEKIFIEIR